MKTFREVLSSIGRPKIKEEEKIAVPSWNTVLFFITEAQYLDNTDELFTTSAYDKRTKKEALKMLRYQYHLCKAYLNGNIEEFKFLSDYSFFQLRAADLFLIQSFIIASGSLRECMGIDLEEMLNNHIIKIA